MSSPSVLQSAKFITLPINAKSRKNELEVFELELMEKLLKYHLNGHEYEERVYIDRFIYKKASFVLVSKGLAAYVKKHLYPSEAFVKKFFPIYESIEAEDAHERLHSAYQEFILID